MRATIIRKIESKVMDVSSYSPIWVERETPHLNEMAQEGANPLDHIIGTNIYYEGVQVFNPESKLKEVYYVRKDDNKLFKDLVIVSNHFVQEQIREVQKKMLEEQAMALGTQRHAIRGYIKKLPWWKRLFNRF